MNHRLSALAGLALGLATLFAQAHQFKLGAITIGHPYARATAAGQPTGGGYMSFVNAGPADKLVAISADVSTSVEMHTMTMEGDVMRMPRASTTKTIGRRGRWRRARPR